MTKEILNELLNKYEIIENIPIAYIGLNQNTFRLLNFNGIITVGELEKVDSKRIKEFKTWTPRHEQEIKKCLKELNIYWKLL